MKKFVFSMRGILDARLAMKSARETELFNARAAYNREVEKLAELQRQMEKALAATPDEANRNAFYYMQRERYMKNMKELKRRQEFKVNEAKTIVESSIARLKEAILEVKKMEKVRESEHKAWELEFRREEQKTNDEIALSRIGHLNLVGSYE